MIVDRNSIQSRALAMLRFPLAALIVLLHTGYEGASTDVTYYIAHYVIGNIVTLSVPAFFFMSGYLFFMGKEPFSLSVYVGKMRKKIKGLLIPYLLWNIIAYLLGIAYKMAKDHTIGEVMPWNLISIFWAQGEGIIGTSLLGYTYPAIVSPASGVLWFIRDLFIMMLCSPIIYAIIKRIKWGVFPLLFFLNVFKLGIPFVGFSLPAVTFFSLGSFFSIHQKDVFDWVKNRNIFWFLSFLLIMIICVFTEVIDLSLYGVDIFLHHVVGVFACFSLAYYFASREDALIRWNLRLAETSFWIYCFHATMIIWLLNKEVGYFLNDIQYVGYTLSYIYMFVARLIECVIAFYILKKLYPSVLGVLIGGRLTK